MLDPDMPVRFSLFASFAFFRFPLSVLHVPGPIHHVTLEKRKRKKKEKEKERENK